MLDTQPVLTWCRREEYILDDGLGEVERKSCLRIHCERLVRGNSWCNTASCGRLISVRSSVCHVPACLSPVSGLENSVVMNLKAERMHLQRRVWWTVFASSFTVEQWWSIVSVKAAPEETTSMHRWTSSCNVLKRKKNQTQSFHRFVFLLWCTKIHCLVWLHSHK